MLSGKNSEADKWLTQACELEDNTAFMFGPPSVVKPAHEMYAEWLIENNQIEAAQFHIAKALEKTPGRKVVVELNEATSTASPSI